MTFKNTEDNVRLILGEVTQVICFLLKLWQVITLSRPWHAAADKLWLLYLLIQAIFVMFTNQQYAGIDGRVVIHHLYVLCRIVWVAKDAEAAGLGRKYNSEEAGCWNSVECGFHSTSSKFSLLTWFSFEVRCEFSQWVAADSTLWAIVTKNVMLQTGLVKFSFCLN